MKEGRRTATHRTHGDGEHNGIQALAVCVTENDDPARSHIHHTHESSHRNHRGFQNAGKHTNTQGVFKTETCFNNA